MKCFKKKQNQVQFSRVIAVVLVLTAMTLKAESESEPTEVNKMGFELLDKVSVPASGAYSLRKLRSAYNGPSIEVQRSSDNTTKKILFGPSGDLETNQMLAFVGDGNGTIRTWYDQSGNGFDAVQTTVERQRIIVKAGKLIVFLGTMNPAHIQGSNGESFNNDPHTPSNLKMVRATASVFMPTDHPAPSKEFEIRYPGMSCLFWTGDYGTSLYAVDGCVSFDNGGGAPDAQIKSDVNMTNKGVVATYVNPSKADDKRAAYLCGSLIGTERSSKLKHKAVVQVAGVGIGEQGKTTRGHGYGFVGYYAEFIYFTKDITTADRELIEGNQAWHYGLEKSLPDSHPYKKSATAPSAAVAMVKPTTPVKPEETKSVKSVQDTAVKADEMSPEKLAELLKSCSIDSIKPVVEGGGTFELREYAVSIKAPQLNTFRASEMALDAEFTLPSGAVMKVPGFYGQNYELKDSKGIVIQGSAGWKIRFSGSEVGAYKFKVILQVKGKIAASADGPTFTLQKSTSHGMVQIAKDAPRYLEFNDGTSYVPVGQNVCFTADVMKTYGHMGKVMKCITLPWYEAFPIWFGKMSANGANWTRVWLAPNFQLEVGKPWDWSLENAWKFDNVLDSARKNGLHICLCFNAERDDNSGWSVMAVKGNAWGALLTANNSKFADFGTLEAAREMYRDKIRYIIARWGYSPNIFSWELWNEIECAKVKNMDAWSKEMTTYIRAIDPWKHLIKSSAHHDTPVYWTSDQGDLNDIHGYYGWQGTTGTKNMGTFLPYYAGAVRKFGRAFIVAETGVARDTGNATEEANKDTTCFQIHEILWAGIFSGSVGTGMTWWWEEQTDLYDGYRHFKAISNFIKDVPFNKENFALSGGDKVKLTNLGLIAFELRGMKLRLLWLRQKDLGWFSFAVDKKVFEPVKGATLTLTDVEPGSYTVEFWNTDKGELISSSVVEAKEKKLAITLPDVALELALKVIPK